MADSGYSQQDPDDSASEHALIQFKINQTLARVRTMVLVQVMAVTGGGGAIAKPPTVNVQPLVKIIDGQGNVSSHGVIFNIPVFRLGGGNGAVILDPVKGDIGWLAVADRDISIVKKTGKESQPGSRRKFDMADGVYLGAILSAAPTQYLAFSSTGITLQDANSNSIKTDQTGININGVLFNPQGHVVGNLTVTGNFNLNGTIQAQGGGNYTGNIVTTGTVAAKFGVGTTITLDNHIHPGTNAPPTPGH